ncbi:hypothetical protein DV736_g3190, partial [Chaetothyriales sp. CBS 134916]
MERLKQRILDRTSHGIVSILGLGGVGKSRLALELIHQLKPEYSRQSYFWVEATDQLSFERDILEIGKKLGIPGIEDSKADAKTLVKQWLCNVLEDRWLLVLDNADDEAIWGARSNPPDQTSTLAGFLPSSINGSIIITTRSRRVANCLAGKEVIQLPTMSREEARKILTNTLEKPETAADENLTSVLLEKLTYLPLAIIQAATYINMTQEPMKIYLELLNEPEEEIIKLLSDDFGDRSRYSSAHNAVATTWLVSFNQIRKYHPLAAKLLSFMACLHEKNIPRSLLPEISSKKDAIDAFATLQGYSFVIRQTRDEGETRYEVLYDMHRLVYLAARNWLRREGSLCDWTKSSLRRMAELFPTRDHRHKDIWTIYLPHAERLCEDAEVVDLPERYDVLEKMGLCFVVDGKYDAAVKVHTAVVQWRERGSGTSEERILEAYNNLGEALQWSGDLARSATYLQKAVRRQEEVLGAEHPSTLTSMANLASTFWNQGRWKEAEAQEVQVMETRSKVLGAEHPDTLTSMANLASIYWSQGQWKEAEVLEVQVMETRSKVFGAEHPDTLTSMSNLASTYRNQGQWKEAEELNIQVMETRSKVLGAEHPSTLTSMSNLASTYRNQGQWKEAEALNIQVMETMSKVFGAEHPSTLTSMANLASIYQNQGYLERSIPPH